MTAAKKRIYWAVGPDYSGEIALDSRGIPVVKPSGKTRLCLMRPYRSSTRIARFYCERVFSSFEELELFAAAVGADELVDVTSSYAEEVNWPRAAEEAYGGSA